MDCIISCFWLYLGTEMRRKMALGKATPPSLRDSCSSPDCFALGTERGWSAEPWATASLSSLVEKPSWDPAVFWNTFLIKNSQECLCGGAQGSRRGCCLFWVVVPELQRRGDRWAFQVSQDCMVDFNVYVLCSPVNQKSVEDGLRCCSNEVQAW